VAAADRLAQLPALLARLAPGPQRLLPPGPGLHRPRRQQEGRDRPRLPAAGRQLPAVGRRPLPAQPQLRQRDRRRQAAGARLPDDGRGVKHCTRGLGIWEWASNDGGGEPDVVLACAATSRRSRRSRRRDPARAPARAEGAGRQRRRPDALQPDSEHPHGLSDAEFDALFTTDQAGDLRLPRLPVADPPPHLPAHQPPQHPRARLQGGGHDHDAVRHGDAQRPRPLPPRDGRDRPRPRPRRARRAPAPADASATGSSTAASASATR
jgi:hypothetical protein